MKLLRTELIQAPETALLQELKGTLEEVPVELCLRGRTPWVAPSPFESWGVDYRGPTPLIQFQAWHGKSWLEGSRKIGDSELYMSGIPEPQRTPNALLRGLLKQEVRVFLANPENIGLAISALELVSPDWRRKAKRNEFLIFPDWIIDKIVDLHHRCNFGWAENLKALKNIGDARATRCWNNYEYIEFRYWADPVILDDISGYDGRAVVHLRKDPLPPKIVVAEGFCPVKCGEDLRELERGFYYAMPVHKDRAYKVIPTSLQGIDEVLIPRGGIRGRITGGQICSFVSEKLKKVKTITEAAEALGEYYERIEDELVDALAPPRMVVAQRKEQKVVTKFLADERKIPETSDLKAVQDVVPAVYDPTSYASKWVIDMLCRVAVVCHSRGAVLFSKDYKTELFSPADIIRSIMKVSQHRLSPYLNRMVLIGGLSGSEFQRQIRTMDPTKAEEQKAPPLAGLGVSIDDLFK